MKKEPDKKTENFLQSFSLRPPPQNLKEKILDSAIQKKKINHVMTPILWKGLIGCLFLLVTIFAVDAEFSKKQSERINSMAGLSKTPPVETSDAWSMLPEVFWEPSDSYKDTGRKKYYALRKKRGITTRQHEWRESLEKELE